MRATVPKNPLFGGGQAETLFSSMRDEEMAREISAQGGFGLSRLLFERLGRGAAACAFQPEDSGAPAVDAGPTDQYGTKGPSDGD
jgi:Rod binding domain-containing protein